VKRRGRHVALLIAGTLGAVSCASGGSDEIAFDAGADGAAVTTTEAGLAATSAGSPVSTTEAGSAATSDATPPSTTEAGATATSDPDDGPLEVGIDATAPGAEISPLILGLSSSLSSAELEEAGIQLNSWGGNPSTRFNYQIGHAWNNGRDWEFRNTNYGASGDTTRGFIETNSAAAAETRLAVPTIGWVAKDDNTDVCSFPDDEGGCTGGDGSDCENQNVIADPRRANTESTPEMVAEWVGGLVADGHAPRFIAMDNEPDLWGFTHYDVHPDCPTYEEVRDTYLRYATAIREVAPDAELTGPVICCWFDYWGTAPGPADGSNEDFLSWFLRAVRAHDEQYGKRTLDVVDVHYYPQSPVFNDETDAKTNAQRLRSTRALWDPQYVDESWIDEPIAFIPRVKRIIENAYPDTPLFISEWNFGADGSMNGALAIAEVLGIYGREGVYAAAYWRNPEVGSPGYLAFRMHGNYDGEGSRFGGRVVATESPDPDRLSVFGALDETAGVLRLMLINKDPGSPMSIDLRIDGFTPAPSARRFTYGPDDLSEIVTGTYTAGEAVRLPASSITVLELAGAEQ
jgi:Glycoside hydrolase family 44